MADDAGFVPPVGAVMITQKNKFSVGEKLEIMKPDGNDVTATVMAIYSTEGEERTSAPHSKEKLYVVLSAEAEEFDILRRCDEEGAAEQI